MASEITLAEVMRFRPAIIGIGNTLRSDDGAGVELVQQLLDLTFANGLVVHGNPENYLQKIAAMPGEARLWVDVIHLNRSPGEYQILTAGEIGQFAISTHNFSLRLLVDFLKPLNDVPDFFLGIQPHNISLGGDLSNPVRKTVDYLVQNIISLTSI